MWRSILIGLGAWAAWASLAWAQGPFTAPPPQAAPPPSLPPAFVPPRPDPPFVWRPSAGSPSSLPGAAPAAPPPAAPVVVPELPPPAPAPPPETAPAASPDGGAGLTLLQQELDENSRQVARLKAEQAKAADDKQAEQLQKQVEVLEKQVEVLQKMIRLLADRVEKQAPAQVERQVATLEARSGQAARRDQELAYAVDDLREQADADRRRGPDFPWTLRQLFDPFDNNETPLSIYGALAFGYSKIIGNAATAANGAGRPSTPGGFYFGEFSPDFFLKLNDWVLLSAEISAGGDGSVSLGSFAEADFFVCDWLTIIAGRFVAPIGWYNLRSNNPWVTKLPTDAPGSAPLLWQQVLPPFALLGVQAQGSFYLGCSPLKLEYNAYVSNGLNLTPAKAVPNINELANLENMESTFSVISNDKLMGGRLGLWWPECGLEGGVSGLINGDYVAGGFEDSISLWALNLNYHKGNWDVRAEYGMTYQHAADFIQSNIRRRGFYGEVAYRPWDCPNKYLQNLEFIYRYGYVDFRGIDAKSLDLTTFNTPIDVPVRRHQNEFGIDYWFAPRMVLKCAYQINNEPGFHLHDNQFITEFAWGW
jgi:hypothetical protein